MYSKLRPRWTSQQRSVLLNAITYQLTAFRTQKPIIYAGVIRLRVFSGHLYLTGVWFAGNTNIILLRNVQ